MIQGPTLLLTFIILKTIPDVLVNKNPFFFKFPVKEYSTAVYDWYNMNTYKLDSRSVFVQTYLKFSRKELIDGDF